MSLLLEKARADEEQHKRALRDLEESSSCANALRARQQAEEVALPPWLGSICNLSIDANIRPTLMQTSGLPLMPTLMSD